MMNFDDENAMLEFNKEIKEQVVTMNKGYIEISIEALQDLIISCEATMIGGIAKEEIVSPNGAIPKGAYVTVKLQNFYHDFTALVDYRCHDESGEDISIEEVPMELIKIKTVF